MEAARVLQKNSLLHSLVRQHFIFYFTVTKKSLLISVIYPEERFTLFSALFTVMLEEVSLTLSKIPYGFKVTSGLSLHEESDRLGVTYIQGTHSWYPKSQKRFNLFLDYGYVEHGARVILFHA